MQVFEGDTASQAWNVAMQALGSVDDAPAIQPGRTGETREILHACLVINNPIERWTLTRVPAMNPAFAIAEVIWILCGRNDSYFLNHWNRQLSKYAGNGTTYTGAYGFRLRSHFGIDQIARAYHALANNSQGRQVVLQMWDPAHDFPNQQGQPQHRDIPCNTGAYLKIRNNKLEWMQLNRSNDMYLGVPHNFIQFTTIQEVIAGWLGVDVGRYHHLSDSLHIYMRDIEKLKVDQSLKVMDNMDSLQFPRDEFESHLRQLEQLVDLMLTTPMSEAKLRSLVNRQDLPRGFQNMLIVLAAEFSRREGWLLLSEEIIGRCSNPVLLQAWDRWTQRFQS